LHIYDLLYKAGLRLTKGKEAERRLKELRGMYEPYVNALSLHMLLAIPSWTGSVAQKDNWQTSAWEMPAGKNARRRETHF